MLLDVDVCNVKLVTLFKVFGGYDVELSRPVWEDGFGVRCAGMVKVRRNSVDG